MFQRLEVRTLQRGDVFQRDALFRIDLEKTVKEVLSMFAQFLVGTVAEVVSLFDPALGVNILITAEGEG